MPVDNQSFTRCDQLLARMTLEDKINLVTGKTEALAHLGIPRLGRVDASCGLRRDTGVTAFPVPIALAATFNAQLAYDCGVAIGTEARAHGWAIVLGPTVDVDRMGLSGRQTESYGEDPLINGTIGGQVAAGIQSQHLITTLKHYTVYNQETDRTDVNLTVSERALRELYNVSFRIALKEGGALSVMGSYPKINGTFACEHPELLALLRHETDWSGFFVADFKAGQDNVAGFNAGIDSTTLWPDFPVEAFTNGQISETRLTEAARHILYAIVEAGLLDDPVPDLNQSLDVSTPEHQQLAQTIAEESFVLLKNAGGLLPLSREKQQTIAVFGPSGKDVLTGVEGSTYVIPGDFTTPLAAITVAANDMITVISAQGSAGDMPLPIIPGDVLAPPPGKSAGLLGAFYDNPDFAGEPMATQVMPTVDFAGKPVSSLPEAWSARWTGTLTPTTTGPVTFSVLCAGTTTITIDNETVIAGMRFGANFVSEGCYYPLLGTTRLTAGQPVPISIEYSTRGAGFTGPQLRIGWQSDKLIQEAVTTAQQADVAIIFATQGTGEGMDRDSFDLPGDQNRLIEAVSAVNPNTIVVLNTPGAVLMPWLDRVASVLQIWYPGRSIGTATAAILFGDAEPSGRLPITFPASNDQGPTRYSGREALTLAEGVFVGYRYYQKYGQTPRFPFGFGLSYTEFEYSALEIMASGNDNIIASVRVTVTNTGSRPGSEVVQVYTGTLPTDVETPPKQLAGFAKVKLAPGQSETVTIPIAKRLLSYWDEDTRIWITPKGDVTVTVGRSSSDNRLTTILPVR